MRTKLLTILTLATLSCPLKGIAQYGDLDPSFGTNGIVEARLGQYAEENINDMLLLPNGQYLLGSTIYLGTSYAFLVQRFNSDGSVDPVFAGMGSFVYDTDGIDDHFKAMALQPDGKVIVFGYTETSPKFTMTTVRINSDGYLDMGFGDNGVVSVAGSGSDFFGNDVVVQPNGKIILAGHGNGVLPAFRVARLNANGSLDGSFGTSGIFYTWLGGAGSQYPSVELQADGKIVLAGVGGIGSAEQKFFLMRVNTDGTLDNDFSGDGIQLAGVDPVNTQQRPYGMAIQPDGKIVVVGKTDYVMTVMRFNTDGELDNSFANNGIRTEAYAVGENILTDVLIQPDGAILTSGYTMDLDGNEDWILMRMHADGSADNTFGTGSFVNTDFTGGNARAQALAFQNNGKILAAGYSIESDGDHYNAVARYESGVNVGVDEVNTKNSISIYPNPSADVFHITLPSDVRSTSLTLRNALGQTLLSERVSGTTTELDLSDLADGVYFLSMEGGSATPTKLVKQ